MKNEQQRTFHKKLRAKDGAEIKLFMLLLIQGYFLLGQTFVWVTFWEFFQKFCTLYEILFAWIPIFYFFKDIFLRSYCYFLETLLLKKKDMAKNIEFFLL